MVVRRGYAVVGCSEVGGSNDEVHMVVGVVILKQMRKDAITFEFTTLCN